MANLEHYDAVIVGAGMAGITCAESLQRSGLRVCVLEKSRGAGGRMSTRRVEDTIAIDHGCQYFRATTPEFKAAINDWMTDRLVAAWDPVVVEIDGTTIRPLAEDTERKYVGHPGMNSLLKSRASKLNVEYNTRAAGVNRKAGNWQIIDDEQNVLVEADWVISTAPPEQSADLFSEYEELNSQLVDVNMTPCWCAMLAFDEPIGCEFDAAKCHDDVLSWIARNNSKPGRRDEPETWCLHATSDWSSKTLESDPEEILPVILEAFFRLISLPISTPVYQTCHRWRYALAEEGIGKPCVASSDLRAIACGDWCLGNRVEHAFLSGLAAADFIKKS